MKYVRCPRCGLNYIPLDTEMCQVCQDEINCKRSIFDDCNYDELMCPYCERNAIGLDEIMCAECYAKRHRNKN